MTLLANLDSVPWAELFHQARIGQPPVSGSVVPALLRALAEHGPHHAIAHEVNAVGRPDEVPRTVASELSKLMRLSPIASKMVPFVVELAVSEISLPARTTCVRWLHLFFTRFMGTVAWTHDPTRAERAAAKLEGLPINPKILAGADLESSELAPSVAEALALIPVPSGETSGPAQLRSLLKSLWERDLHRAISRALEPLLGALEGADRGLLVEIMVLASWLPERRALSVPRLEQVLQSGDPLLRSMALLALARLDHEPARTAIQVLGDELESQGGDGLPAIYLACADVLATKGEAGPRSRDMLITLPPPQLAQQPDPFGTTVAELVKTVAAELVWPLE